MDEMIAFSHRSSSALHAADRAADCPTARVSRSHYDRLRELLAREGIPFVTAKTEAEKCCAWMAKNGLVDLVLTDDSDALAYGAPQVYFNPWINSASRPKQVFSLQALLDGLKLSSEQFVQLCSLLDNDFNKNGARLDGMSFEVAYRLLRAHGSVEKWTKSVSYRIHCDKPSVGNAATWSLRAPFEEYTDPSPQFGGDPDPENMDPPRRCLAKLEDSLATQIRGLWEAGNWIAEDLSLLNDPVCEEGEEPSPANVSKPTIESDPLERSTASAPTTENDVDSSTDEETDDFPRVRASHFASDATSQIRKDSSEDFDRVESQPLIGQIADLERPASPVLGKRSIGCGTKRSREEGPGDDQDWLQAAARGLSKFEVSWRVE